MGELARILVEKVTAGVRWFLCGYLIGYVVIWVGWWLTHLGR